MTSDITSPKGTAAAAAAAAVWSLWGNIYIKGRNRLALQRAEKLVMIRGNAKNVEHRRSEEEVVLSLLAEK